MYHHSDDHVGVGDEVADAAALMAKVEPEMYSTFISFQETLMHPYTSPGGKFSDEMYEKMMPIAARLACGAATLAAAESFKKATIDCSELNK